MQQVPRLLKMEKVIRPFLLASRLKVQTLRNIWSSIELWTIFFSFSVNQLVTVESAAYRRI